MNDQDTKKPTLGFVDAIKSCFSQYASFSGRARRSEYWYWYLFYILIVTAASLIDVGTGTGWISILFYIALILPSLSVAVRRLHDISKSGWNILWSLIPIIGALYLIYLFVLDSVAEENEYGESPKYVKEEDHLSE